tara:strand:+ start:908 stop:1180 length:273 start_codon:yes stop_codon:yes gene_type:complete
MIKIIKLIDELRGRLSSDYPEFIYEIIDNIEKEVRKPIKIYRSPSRFIYDVQPNFSWNTVDQKMGDPRKTDTQKKNNYETKVLNLAKLTE